MKWLALAVLAVGAFLLFQRFTGGGDRIAAASFADRPPDALVLDVRTPDEFAQGHVAGAVNVNVLAPGFEAAVAGYDRDRPVYTYCASGHRSGRAAQVLEGLGFQTVRNAGGFSDLARAGADVER